MNTYQKNIDELLKVNPSLAKKLLKLKTNKKYEVFQGSDYEDTNILDTKTQEFLYIKPKEDNTKILTLFEGKKEFPFLYLFGIGNGYVISKLLENKKLERLVIFEPEVELLFIALNFFDFTEALKSIRLVIMTPSQFNFALGIHMFGHHKSRFYAKVYNLETTLLYYNKNYLKSIKKVNQLITKSLHHVVSVYGNDVTDTLTGFKHHICNLRHMLNGYRFSELIQKKNTEVAIIVSTGPSLQKQLGALKQIQDYVTIISVDASLPILEKNDILPDIVTSIERVPLTAKFFQNTSEDFQKKIIFVSASLQHQDTLDAIKGKKVITMRPFNYNRYFQLNNYGYLGSGMSSANMAHELALKMGYKTCILIGQDLAFAPDGKSHSRNHVFGENDLNKDKVPTTEITSYGGKGKVKSSFAWVLFKNYFEQLIEESKNNFQTINATEGGAQITGALEIPFKEAILKLIDKKNKKNRIELTKITHDIIEKDIIRIKNSLQHLISEGAKLQKELEQAFTILFEACQKMENKTQKEMLALWSIEETAYYINIVAKIRHSIEINNVLNDFFYDAIQSDLLHYELDLAKIKVMHVSNQDENQKKAIQWIMQHRIWLFTLAGTLQNIIDILKKEESNL